MGPVDGGPLLVLDGGASGVIRLGRGGWGSRLSAEYYRSSADFFHHVQTLTNPYYRDDAFSAMLAPAVGPTQFAVDPEDPGAVLRLIEQVRDREILATPEAVALREGLIGAFGRCAGVPGEPWESGGIVEIPGGGYVQWTRVAGPGSAVHVEVSDATDFDRALPGDLVALLVDLGWNEPDGEFRNGWVRARTDAEFTRVAALVVRTLVSAFGVERRILGRLVTQ